MDDDTRLQEIMEVIVAIAANDFSRRARVGSGGAVLDAIATGLNMLAEEVARQVDLENSYAERLAISERLAAAGQLAASVAHEINNPVAAVLGNLAVLDDDLHDLGVAVDELASRGRADPSSAWVLELLERYGARSALTEARRISHDTQADVQRVAATVRGLRAYAERGPGHPESLVVNEVVEDAARLVSRQLAYRARVVPTLAPGLPPVQGDRAQLVQVFTQLLLFASTTLGDVPAEEARIELRSGREGDHVLVTVHDNGPGLTDADRARVFTPAFTAHPLGRGEDVALAVCQEIVRRQGGSLTCESAPGRGTTMRVALAIAAKDRTVARGSQAIGPASGPRKPRVLVVDDDDSLLKMYRRILATSYDLTCAAGGREALVVLEGDRAWDVVLCDLMMPDVDGAAVYAWVERQAPELLPRLLFTSGARGFTPQSQMMADRLGHRLLEKPLSRDTLLKAISTCATAGR